MFGFLKGVVKPFSDAAESIGKGIAKVAETIGDGVSDLVDEIHNIPILGQAFDLAFTKMIPAGIVIDVLRTAVQIANGKPIDQAILDMAKAQVLKTQALGDTAIRKEGYSNLYRSAGDILEGKPVKAAAITLLKRETAEIKKVGPYAQAVVSFVPGVGTGAAAALAAGIALSEGASIDDIALAAVKGALPGGPLVQSAFSVAQAAAEGKPIDTIVVNALPISPQAKQAVKLALDVAKDIAAGKKVTGAMLAQADKAFALVSPEIAKALNVGMAVGIARALQASIAKEITPESLGQIAEIGSLLSQFDTVVAAGRNANPSPEYQRGFDIATGALNARAVNAHVMLELRNRLEGIAQQGFDASAALLSARLNTYRKLGKRETKLRRGWVDSRSLEERRLAEKAERNRMNKPANMMKNAPVFVNPNRPGARSNLLGNSPLAKIPLSIAINAPPPPEPRTFASIAEGQRKIDEAVKAGRPAVIITAMRAMLEQTKLAEAKRNAIAAGKPTPTEKAGYMIAIGLEKADSEQKTAVVAALAANPEARAGVAKAIEDKKDARGWIQRLLDWLFG